MKSQQQLKEHAAYMKAWRLANPAKSRATARRYRNRHPDRHRQARLSNPLTPLFCNAKQRAKRDHLPFGITQDDLLPLPTHCPILGIEINYTRSVLGNDSPSIDKVVPDKGYVKGNVPVISNRANQKKSDLTLEELERLVAYVKGETYQRTDK